MAAAIPHRDLPTPCPSQPRRIPIGLLRFLGVAVALAALGAPAFAAVEQVTLIDGRVFIGEYDDELGQLHTTLAGKPCVLAIAQDHIAERAPFHAPKAAPVEAHPARSAGPKVVTAAEKAAAERDAAWGRKVREADQLSADAAKARRDAAAQRTESVHHLDQARRDWLQFRKRAAAEGMSLNDQMPDPLSVFKGESEVLSKRDLGRADEEDALAVRLQAQSDAARTEAGMMPHSDR